MIYSDDIQIPVLCPIQFKEPREIDVYFEQAYYIPKFVFNNYIQILISEDMYDDYHLPLELVLFNAAEVEQIRFGFVRGKLSTGYYYATAFFNSNAYEGCHYFEIHYNGVKCADSIAYDLQLSSGVDDDIKRITYSHSENDWNVVFTENNPDLRVPVRSAVSDVYKSIKISYDTVGSQYKVLFEFYETTWANVEFKLLTPTLTPYTALIENNDTDTYTLNIPVDTITAMEDKNLAVRVSFSGGTISDTRQRYLWNQTFQRTLTFAIDVECGYIPNDFRGEQETQDFLDQTMINETVYGNHYAVHPMTFNGIPNWLAYKLMCATLCDDFRVDNEVMKRTEGSKFEKVEDTYNGLAIYKIDLQTENNYLQ